MKKLNLKKINKKPLIALILLLILIITVGGTFAYFSSETRIANEFKAKTYNITLTEEFHNDFGTKVVTLENKDESGASVVLRVNYNEIWKNSAGEILNNKIDGKDIVTKGWTNTFLNDFVLSEDGWYYYKKALNANESVTILETIEENVDLINAAYESDRYAGEGTVYQLIFNYEAVQATEDAVKDLWGYNVIINNGDVTWPF